MDLQGRVAGERLIADGTRRVAAHCTQTNPLSLRCNIFDCVIMSLTCSTMLLLIFVVGRLLAELVLVVGNEEENKGIGSAGDRGGRLNIDPANVYLREGKRVRVG